MVKGRTTRMVQEAKRLADQGKTVFILAASHTHAHVLRTWITDSRIAVDTVGCGDFDWHTMTLRGMSPDCVVLVDHFAIELYWNKLLTEYHRYDTTTDS
jgi:hypothetical protein